MGSSLKSPLKQWRLSVGMTQMRLAELAQVTQGHISQVENGLVGIEGNLRRYLADVADIHNQQERFVESIRQAAKNAEQKEAIDDG